MKKLNLFKSLFLAILVCAYSFAGAANKYVKVTENLADWTGKYLIVCEKQNVAFNGALSDLDRMRNHVAVETLTNGEIIGSSKIDSAVFNIAKCGSAYSVQSFSGLFIKSNQNGKELKSSTAVDSSYVINISIGNDKNVLLETASKTKGYLKYNLDEKNGLRFRFYADPNGQTPVQLYKLNETPSTIETPQFSVAPGDVFAPFDLTLTCATADAKIYYNLDGGAQIEYTQPIRIDKTLTLNAWAEKGSEKSRIVTAKYVFHESNKVSNIRDFKEQSSINQDQSFVLTGEVQVLLIHEKTSRIFLFDNTGDIKVYDKELAKKLKVGDKLTNISCKYESYQSKPQMKVLETPIIKHASLQPKVKKIYEVQLSDSNTLVMLRDVEILVSSENEKINSVNFTEDPKGHPEDLFVTDGTNPIAVRSHYCNFTGEYRTGDRVDVVGYVSVIHESNEKFSKPKIHIVSLNRVKPQDLNAANIRELISKLKADTTAEFTVTGDVIVTFRDDVKKEVYFQDATAAISSDNAYYLSNIEVGKTLRNMKVKNSNNRGRLQFSIESSGDEISVGEPVPDIMRITELVPSMEDRFVRIEKLKLVNSITFDQTARSVESYDNDNNYIILNSKFKTAKGHFEYHDEVNVTGIVEEEFGAIRLNIIDIKRAYDIVSNVATPVLSEVDDGVKSKPFDLTITCATEGAKIFYKKDTEAAVEYTEPIHIDKNTSLTVWAEKDGEKSRMVKVVYEFPEITFVPNLAKFIETAQNDKHTLFGIEGTVVVTYKYGDQIFVQDETAAMIMANEKGIANRLKIGDHLTGLVALGGEYKNDVQLLVKSLPKPVAGEAVADIKKITEISDMINYRYIEVEEVEIANDVTFDSSLEDGVNVEVKDKDGNVLKIREHFRNIDRTFQKGDKVNVKGIVSVYRNDAELKIVSIRKVGETPVENVELQSSVFSSNGMLFIEAEAGAGIEVYAIDGRCIASMIAESDLTAIDVNADMVIVRVNGECHKMIVK